MTAFSFYNLKFLENSDIIYIESEEKGKVIIMDIENIGISSVAVQVKFWDGENWCAGFMVGRRLVCGCCGGIFDVDEILENGREEGIENPIHVFQTWVDVSDEIWDDDGEGVHDVLYV